MIPYAGYESVPRPTGVRYSVVTRHQAVMAFQQLLADRGTMLTVEAAAALNVTQRTICRYMNDLRAQGVKIDGCRGRGGGIRLARTK